MTLYIIGLGLNIKSLSLEALEIIKKTQVYLESYTVEFPYKIEELEQVIGKKVEVLKREKVESDFLVKEAKTKNIALLVYGSPLMATTHISLILECKKQRGDYKVIHNASIFDAVVETGLQAYKFGKTASMPKWTEKYKPESFIEIIKDNLKIKAHTLLLIDIGLEFNKALQQIEQALKNKKLKLEKIVVCSQMGYDSKIYYDKIENLKYQEIKAPFCFIIPTSDLHFIEKEALKKLKANE